MSDTKHTDNGVEGNETDSKQEGLLKFIEENSGADAPTDYDELFFFGEDEKKPLNPVDASFEYTASELHDIKLQMDEPLAPLADEETDDDFLAELKAEPVESKPAHKEDIRQEEGKIQFGLLSGDFFMKEKKPETEAKVAPAESEQSHSGVTVIAPLKPRVRVRYEDAEKLFIQNTKHQVTANIIKDGEVIEAESKTAQKADKILETYNTEHRIPTGAPDLRTVRTAEQKKAFNEKRALMPETRLSNLLGNLGRILVFMIIICVFTAGCVAMLVRTLFKGESARFSELLTETCEEAGGHLASITEIFGGERTDGEVAHE